MQVVMVGAEAVSDQFDEPSRVPKYGRHRPTPDMILMWIVLLAMFGLATIVCSERGMLDFPDENDPPPVSGAKLGVYGQAAVVTNTEPCSEIGRDILSRGGSAVDAIIATLLCEGLCGMQNMGIGGGVFMTIYKKNTRKAFTLDAREAAPMSASRHMYKGNPNLSSAGALSIGVPGELMGYWEAHRRFGVLPWYEIFEPAITMCINGVPVNARLAKSFAHSGMEAEIMESPTLRQVLAPNGRLPKVGEIIRLPALARTLTAIAKEPEGAKALYDGVLTEVFLSDLDKAGVPITREDLASYRARWTDPIETPLRGGYTLYSSPPPASGALLAFIMETLEGVLYPTPKFSTANSIRIAEAFKYAYGLRCALGDPEFVNIEPVLKKAADERYVNSIKEKVEAAKKTRSEYQHYGGNYYSGKDSGTINIVVLAPNGDAVVATSTINTLFGSLIASPSTGIILNNEMDDFSSPSIVNSFGLPASPANFIEPKKRPLSSACPTIITGLNGEPRMIVGAAGGTHITSATAQVIINHLWFGMNIKQAVDMPRIHHQLMPMVLKYEQGIPKSVVDGLVRAGHRVKGIMPHSSVTAIANVHGTVTAIYDFRRGGNTSGF